MRHPGRTNGRRARSGQFIIIYMMSFFCMVLIAYAALGVGQVVVRKQWAQLIADAGAFAGASKQAEGLNTISRITEFQYDLLSAIQLRDRAIGYKTDSWTECWAAYFGSMVSEIRDRHENVDNVFFQPLNIAVDLLNHGYRELAYLAARDVTDQNIEAFFTGDFNNNGSPDEDADNFDYPTAGGYLPGLFPLLKMTDVFYETVAWKYYTFDPGPCPWGVCLGYVCTGLSAINCDITGIAGLYGFPPHSLQPSPPESSYTFEKVLKVMKKDNETTFLWFVKVPATKPILGFTRPFGNIPDIIAIARGKPYGGHIGWGDGSNDEAEEWPTRGYIPGLTWAVWWNWDKSPQQTYKAKLVPILPIRVAEDSGVLIDFAASYPGSPRELLELLGIAH